MQEEKHQTQDQVMQHQLHSWKGAQALLVFLGEE